MTVVLGSVTPQQVFAFGVTTVLGTNDPGFTNDSQNVDRQWALSKARFTEAWAKTTGSNAVIVAVVDTGVDQTHEDLRRASFAAGYDFTRDKSIDLGSDSDDNGHGTLVAGIIAATPNNNIGIAGAVWEVTIMPIKALDGNGNGSSESVASAVRWAADHGAHIINLSLGGVGFGQDTGLSNAITYAFRKNVVIVAAAGNDTASTGGDLDKDPVFPICDDNGENMIIGVAAVDVNDQKPAFSNYGRNCVDVSAPGKRILSTIGRDPVTRAKSPNSYAYASGTSLATPLVSSQAALLKSLYPEAGNKQIRDRIITSTDSIVAPNGTQCMGSCAGKLGSGRINVAASLATQILPEVVAEGDLVQVAEDNLVYVISGGKRLPVSSFVRQQRYGNTPVRRVDFSQLTLFPEGPFAAPLDGTLIKVGGDPTVYWVSSGLKWPVSYGVFVQRGFQFGQVLTLTDQEVHSWLTGKFLPPPDGSLVRSQANRTVYWVVGGVLHPISATFYRNRGLSVFPVTYVSEADIKQFPKGEAYLR